MEFIGHEHTLYVSDMDGTLLGADSKLSRRTVTLLNDLIQNRGLNFTVATARTTATVIGLMQDVRASLPYIVLSGAAMWNNTTRDFEDVQAISPDLVLQVCAIFERHDVMPFIYRRHGNVIHTHRCGTLSAVERAFVEARQHTPHKRFLLDDENYHTNADEAMLIFSMRHGGGLEAIAREIKSATPCEVVYYHDNVDPRLALLEVYAPGCTKAAAIARLAQRVGAERVVAFGDNLNDLVMLRAADHSVAVANAVPQVLAEVDEVIGRNVDDSVALYLKQHA